jgi:hypothetical protein
LSLSACGGGVGTAATAASAPTSSTVNAYTGPAPATADVQAFEVNLWNNIRSQNRCGACHNATTPAQMPNFARSDDVNLAYAQANTVVNLAQPSTSLMVTKVSGGHNCWLADNSACGTDSDHLDQQLGGCHGRLLGDHGAARGAAGANRGTELELPGLAHRLPEHGVHVDQQVLRQLPLDHGLGRDHAVAVFRGSEHYQRLPGGDPENRLHGLRALQRRLAPPPAARTRASISAVDRHAQLLEQLRHRCGAMLAQIQAFAQMLSPTSIDPSLVVSKALTLPQGTIASGASRYDADTIAKYEFQTGTGLVAYDTSGIDPSADMTITGSVPGPAAGA